MSAADFIYFNNTQAVNFLGELITVILGGTTYNNVSCVITNAFQIDNNSAVFRIQQGSKHFLFTVPIGASNPVRGDTLVYQGITWYIIEIVNGYQNQTSGYQNQFTVMAVNDVGLIVGGDKIGGR